MSMAGALVAFLSLVLTAMMEAPMESPMMRTPSLLKARAPADLSGTLPVVAPGKGALNASAAARW